MDFIFNAFYTLSAAVTVLLLGRFLVRKSDFFKRYLPDHLATTGSNQHIGQRDNMPMDINFRLMEKNYAAALFAAGHCSLAKAATAVANMQAITNKYGALHKAFQIVPLYGALFADLLMPRSFR